VTGGRGAPSRLAALAALAALTCLCLASPASASPEDEARAHFERGLGLFKQSAWSEALTEFMESRRLHPTRSATRNAALCFHRLGRHDSAVALYEELLAAHKLSDDERRQYQGEHDEIARLVGTIMVQVDEAGVAITVDGLDRGSTPSEAIRVSAGSHVVQLYKEGYTLFRTELLVPGGKQVSVRAELRPLGQSGRLRVTETRGATVDVLVDGARVGRTPWEGALPVGAHSVVLRGDEPLGTQPVEAAVALGELTRLTMTLEPLTAELRIEPTPAGARVLLDGVPLGHGAWQGRVRKGAHLVEVEAGGYTPLQRRVSLLAGSSETVEVVLQRDTTSPLTPNPRGRLTLELTAGVPLGVSLGGGVLTSPCAPPCARSAALGVLAEGHVGYRFAEGLSLGGFVGFLHVRQASTSRPTWLLERPDGLRRDHGVVDDELSAQAFVVGATLGLEAGSTLVGRGRVGVGVAAGVQSDRRVGTFQRGSEPSYVVGPVSESTGAAWALVAPELRLGYRITPRFEVSLGAQALLLAPLSRAVWQNRQDVVAQGFFGFFREEPWGLGPALLLVPSLALTGAL
jgi:hypothetical protein